VLPVCWHLLGTKSVDENVWVWEKGREKNVRFEVLTAVTVKILPSGM
jgi:hypothetical protein